MGVNGRRGRVARVYAGASRAWRARRTRVRRRRAHRLGGSVTPPMCVSSSSRKIHPRPPRGGGTRFASRHARARRFVKCSELGWSGASLGVRPCQLWPTHPKAEPRCWATPSRSMTLSPRSRSAWRTRVLPTPVRPPMTHTRRPGSDCAAETSATGSPPTSTGSAAGGGAAAGAAVEAEGAPALAAAAAADAAGGGGRGLRCFALGTGIARSPHCESAHARKAL